MLDISRIECWVSLLGTTAKAKWVPYTNTFNIWWIVNIWPSEYQRDVMLVFTGGKNNFTSAVPWLKLLALVHSVRPMMSNYRVLLCSRDLTESSLKWALSSFLILQMSKWSSESWNLQCRGAQSCWLMRLDPRLCGSHPAWLFNGGGSVFGQRYRKKGHTGLHVQKARRRERIRHKLCDMATWWAPRAWAQTKYCLVSPMVLDLFQILLAEAGPTF